MAAHASKLLAALALQKALNESLSLCYIML